MTYAEKHFTDLYPLVFDMGITFVLEPIAPINTATAKELVKREPVDHAVVYGIYLIGEKSIINKLNNDLLRDNIINGIVTTMVCADHSAPISSSIGKCIIPSDMENKLLDTISETDKINTERFKNKIDYIFRSKAEEHLDKEVIQFGTVNVLIDTENRLRGQMNSEPVTTE